jgi:hypothetical protein
MSSFTNLTDIGELLEISLPYYFGSYLFLTKALPVILTWFGFGPAGILSNTIASWIQSKYGISYLWSLLQSVGARGGILYPKLWSFISGSVYKLVKSSTDRQTNSADILKTGKPDHSNSTCDIWLKLLVILCVFFLPALFYFNESLRNWLQRIISGCRRILRFQNRHSTATMQISLQRPSTATTRTRNTGRATPLRVTQILPRNSNQTYACPECQRPFRPQGISNHVKSCAWEWCRTNRIPFNQN